MKILIVIPAYNEAENLKLILPEIKEQGFKDILVIDDGSKDDTYEVAKRYGAKVIRHLLNLGVPACYQTGFFYALRKNYDFVITMDADGQHPPSQLAKFVEEIKNRKADLIIGSCPERGNIFKKLIWTLWKILTGLEINDFTSGFRLYSKKAIEEITKFPLFALEYQDIEMLMLFKKRNIKIKEITVKMEKRKKGKTKIFKNIYAILKYLIISFLSIFIPKYGHDF